MRVFLTDEFRQLHLKFSAPRPGDAGYDLYAVEALSAEPGKRALIRTGLHLEIPEGFVGLIKDRSSMALEGLHTLAGVIDPSYRGELKVLLFNMNLTAYSIRLGQKIAQIVVVRYAADAIEVVNQLDQLGISERGSGGFGSTGQ